MKTKISYLEFARPFKYNKDFFVLCHMVLETYAAEYNIEYTNNVKEKCYEFENGTDLLKVRFALNSEKVLRYYWRQLIENDQSDSVIPKFRYLKNVLIEKS
jgi:hypothetical protein